MQMKLWQGPKQIMGGSLQRKMLEIPEFKISGCYGGNIFFSDNTISVNVLTNESGPAILKHASSYASTFRPQGSMSPYLTDGRGQRLSEGSIQKLFALFEYRHGKNEAMFLSRQIYYGNDLNHPISLPDFVRALKRTNFKQKRRTGFLLELILPQFLLISRPERKEPTGKEAWEALRKATSFIRAWTEKFPQINTGDEEILLPILTRYRESIAKIKQDQWQAAAVAAIRKNWLTEKGFQELKQNLSEATEKTLNVVELKLTPDIIHEIVMQEGTQIQGKASILKIGTVRIPRYDVKAASLNANLTGSSGSYKEVSRLIFKELDFGHKIFDVWENFSHRTKDRQVDPNVNFQLLTLLSPKKNRQEVIGANGQVLGDGSYMFVIDPSFRIRYMPAANYVGEGNIAKNFCQFIPHSQLATRGEVAAAGNFVIKEGKFHWIDNGSGHYRVDPSLNTANSNAALENLGYKTENIQFLDRGSHQLDEIYLRGNQILDGLPAGENRPAMTDEIWEIQKTMEWMK